MKHTFGHKVKVNEDGHSKKKTEKKFNNQTRIYKTILVIITFECE